MAWPIVISRNSYGTAVTEVPAGSYGALPYEVATNGYGTPVIFVPSGGIPVTSADPGAELYWRDGTQSRKVIVDGGGDSSWVCTKYDVGSGWCAQEIVHNDFITSGSLGSPAEPFRRSRVYDIVEGMIYNNVATATSGTWTASNLDGGSTSNPYNYPGSIAALRTITSTFSLVSGDYKEYLTYVDADGRFTLLHLVRTGLSTAGCPTGSLTDGVSGEVVGSLNQNVGTYGLTQTVYTHPTKRSTSFTLRISRLGGGGRLTIVGVNSVLMTKPEDPTPPAGVVYSFADWLRTDNYYQNTHGANDYAIAFSAPAVTGGSVHGGETLVTSSCLLDGEAFTISNRGVGTRLTYSFQSLVDARAQPGAGSGDYADVYYSFDLSNDGRPKHNARIVFHSVLGSFYSGMVAVDVRFKQINQPYFIADGSLGAGTGDTVDDYLMGKASFIEWQASNGDKVQRFSTGYRIPGFEQSVLHWDAAQYFKNWDFAVKAINRNPGDVSWYGATSFRRTA